MTREQVLKELNEIFIANFDDDEIVLNDETTSADIEYWDSLEQINIILACEKKWNLKFDIEEINKMKNVGEMVDLIYRKVG
ncbi:MAG: acyl carrier protein [Lachnospiraceae bacterium]|jgi:acyl carrier protein|nr:acyl carrier protein [Lachnospiraceae bacterium]